MDGPEVTLTHGPPLVCILLSCILYGVMCLQCVFFWSTFPNERRWLKIYVALLLFIDTLSTIFAIWWLFDLLIDNFGNPAAFAELHWTLAADVTLVGIVSPLCQLFFAWRIHVLVRKKVWISVPIAILAVVSGVAAMATGIAVGVITDLSTRASIEWIGLVWLTGTAVVDVLITVLLSLNLNRMRTGVRYTDQLLDRIVRVTVANGLITAVFATAEMISYFPLPDTGVHFGLSFILPKLYCNSVMSSLNLRKPTVDPHHLSISNRISTDRPRATHVSSQAPVFVEVSTERHEMYDTPGRWKDAERTDHETST